MLLGQSIELGGELVWRVRVGDDSYLPVIAVRRTAVAAPWPATVAASW